MISAGGVMTFAGMLIAVNNIELNIFPNVPSTTNKNDEGLSVVLLIAGVGAMLGSIGLFKSAKNYKRKALSISFKNELTPQLTRTTVFYKSIPSLVLKISL